jgi:hypothetical protein
MGMAGSHPDSPTASAAINGAHGWTFNGYVEISADSSVGVGSPQYIALCLTNHGGPIGTTGAFTQAIVDGINSDSVGVTASLMPAALQAQYPDYNVLLTVPTPSVDEYLGWNFEGTTLPLAEIGVGDVAAGIAVPEPASIGALMLGALLLLPRRRPQSRVCHLS